MAAPEQQGKPKGIEFYGGYEVYSESGVDLTMLRENLRLSMEERWERNGQAREFALALQQSGRSPKEFAPSPPKALETGKVIALVKRLAEKDVQYVIVGVQAMHAHGSTWMTEEIEICYQCTPTNLEALVAAFATLHPSLRGAPSGITCHFDVPTLAAGLNFPLITDCGYINLLKEVNGIGAYDQVLVHSVEKTICDLPIRISSIDCLIAAEKATGRIKNQLQLLELLELKKMLDAAKPADHDGGPASSP